MRILGIFKNEDHLIEALEGLKKQHIPVEEVYSPYPVERVFKVLRKKTRFPIATFTFAFLGLTFSYFYMYWTTVVDYPLSYGGKPIHSIPSFIIVGFVSMISMGVLFSFIAFLYSSRMYPGRRKLCPDPRVMDDAFVISIRYDGDITKSKAKELHTYFESHGALEVLDKE